MIGGRHSGGMTGGRHTGGGLSSGPGFGGTTGRAGGARIGRSRY